MQRRIGFLLIIVSAMAFGAMAIFAYYAYQAGTDPISLLFLRFTIAAGVMLVLAKLRGDALPRGRLLWGLVAMGAIGYVGQSFCYFTALTLASASLVALLLYLYPVLVAVLATVLLRERMTWIKATALFVALAGAVLTIGPGGGQPLGVALGLVAAVIYSLYIVAGTRIMQQVPAIPASTVIMASAAAVYGGLVAARGLRPPGTPGGWAAVVAIALVSTVLAIVAFFAGLERVGATNAATLSTVEPVVTVSLAALLLGEAITPARMAGGALILAAVLSLARGELSATPAVDEDDARQHQHAAG